MLVRDLMSKNVKAIRPDDSITDAAKQMRDGDFGVMPVCENDKLIGMVTDRDIVVRLAAEGKDIKNSKVRDAMTDEVLYCSEEDDIHQVTRLMTERQVRRIPVLSKDKQLVGILSIGDLAEEAETNDDANVALAGISEKRHDEPRQTPSH